MQFVPNRLHNLEPAHFYNQIALPIAQKIGPYRYYFKLHETLDKFQNGREIKGPMPVPEGGEYFGEMKEKVRSGQGKQRFEDGSVYEGYWMCDKPTGKGRMIHSNGDYY